MTAALDLPRKTFCDRIVEIRRDLHRHPELKFAEFRTARVISEYLDGLGLVVSSGLSGTGVVASIKGGPGPAVALRADMDGLPVQEAPGRNHCSTIPGKMHGCGHDGHVAMLLGAAEVLAEAAARSRLPGTVHLVFQPGEEGGAGARRMIDDGLLERYPARMIFGLHNWPHLAPGTFSIVDGPVMAATTSFEVEISGPGGHAAMPHQCSDTILAGAALVQAIQSIVARMVPADESAVLSVSRFHGGDNNTVMPSRVILGGTMRAADDSTMNRLRECFLRHCAAVASGYQVVVEPVLRPGYPATRNWPSAARIARIAVVEALGPAALAPGSARSMAADDFGYFSQVVPSCYAWLGTGTDIALHSPEYDFNDEVIPYGIAYWVAVAKEALNEGE